MRKVLAGTMVNEAFDRGGRPEGAVFWEGTGRPCFCQGNSYRRWRLGLRTLSTNTTWKVLAFSDCHIDTWRSVPSVVRNLATSDANGSWARGIEGDVGLMAGKGAGVEGGDAGDVGGLRPATNITGASCARSSRGYEFMVAEMPRL